MMPEDTLIAFPEFVERYLATGAAETLDDWQVEIVRGWTNPTTRNVLFSMPRHHGRRAVEEFIDYLTRTYALLERNPNAEYLAVPRLESAHMVDLDEPVSPHAMSATIRVRGPGMEFVPRTGGYQDAIMAEWLNRAFGSPQQVPDEITDEDRERWANELETTPRQGDDSGGALSSDELLEAIGMAVTEWKDVRDA